MFDTHKRSVVVTERLTRSRSEWPTKKLLEKFGVSETWELVNLFVAVENRDESLMSLGEIRDEIGRRFPEHSQLENDSMMWGITDVIVGHRD